MWRALRRLIAANPMGFFLWSIITKWYLIIAVASLITLYYTVLGLKKIGFIDYFGRETEDILSQSKAVAQNCIPKLKLVNGKLPLNEFWDCLSDPGEYKHEEVTGARVLEDEINKFMQKQTDSIADTAHPIIHPYEKLENQNNLNNTLSDNNR
ncbi:DUF2670 domain-containing protein [Rickettsia prowazekii]|uniref:Uncharacterized protein RP269 n=2 Tax=Rickettsia prowazekii TaxID=782 RepID=Y269_RICPR|nr:DUF2670 domain-containing protein [Rickettsia prowazekii]Q9ZDQ6.1 RecName: Full=Uncharacterized protein RP269 [Rickettsia prowazekii str. Madrid E]ADE29782.1 hypothetical protein rpr22_CDS264 [Rickettsia prowazekii str. Rp22]AFE49088.1 hypothetical protein M9W_01315 [Rickettsia prowazekii str. Chernikova]AFE49933.1 hypothetical protein M9Y_01315 [Rickettsia prowazekii str. Katsinyian]AFE50777.1 hypothetical protein MA1_01305 [Rickettsia prowazekii str. BuV67-CWPP]AFE51616.1 hypothetical pr